MAGGIDLEKEKMIATTDHTQEIQFWTLPSGKLEWELDSGMAEGFNILLTKDKNALGVVGYRQNLITIISSIINLISLMFLSL